jgi:hypothetical protein
VKPKIGTSTSQAPYYWAIYLTKRTSKDFLDNLGRKCNIAPSQIIRTARVNKQGLEYSFDDKAVYDLVEGQDMIAEFRDLPKSPNLNSLLTGGQDYSDIKCMKAAKSRCYELKLLY